MAKIAIEQVGSLTGILEPVRNDVLEPVREESSMMGHMNQGLEQERLERTEEVAQLRHDLEFQQATEVATLRNDLESQQAKLAEIVRQLLIQAGALKEGLEDIHLQREALSGLIEKQGKCKGCANHCPVDASKSCHEQAGNTSVSRLESDSKTLRADVNDLRLKLTNDLGEVLRFAEQQREELLMVIEAERAERAQEIAELRMGVEPIAVKSLELNAELARKLGAAVQRSDEQHSQLVSAVESDREARAVEAAEFSAISRTVVEPKSTAPIISHGDFARMANNIEHLNDALDAERTQRTAEWNGVRSEMQCLADTVQNQLGTTMHSASNEGLLALAGRVEAAEVACAVLREETNAAEIAEAAARDEFGEATVEADVQRRVQLRSHMMPRLRS